MTTEFSFARFGMLLKCELIRNYKTYLYLLLVQLGIYLLWGFFGGIDGLAGAKGIFLSYNAVIICIMPFLLYNTLFHSVKGVTSSMLPASQAEKFAVAMFQCIVIMPFLLMFSSWLLSAIGYALTGIEELMMRPWEQFRAGIFHINYNGYDLGFFDSYYWTAIGSQAFALWGTYYFKTRKFWKTVLTFFCAGIALAIIGTTGINIAFDAYAGGFVSFLEDASVNIRLLRITDVMFTIILPVAFWVWSYIKMRRQQF